MPPFTSHLFRRWLTSKTPVGEFARFLHDVVAFAGWRLAALAALTVIAALAEGAGLLMLAPLLSMVGVGAGSGQQENGHPWLAPLGLEGALTLYVILVAAAALVIAARGDRVARLRLGYVDHLRHQLHEAVAAMEWRAFNRLAGAEVVNTVVGDAQRSANGLEFLLRSVGWAVEIPVLLAVALRLSPTMTGAALALGGLSLALSRPLSRHAHRLGRQAVAGMQALHRDLSEDLAGMRVIRAIGLETERARLFESRMRDVRADQIAFQRQSGWARAVTQALAATAAALAVWVAIRILGMELAGTLVLMTAFARLLMTAQRIQDAWRIVLHALPAHAAVLGLLDRCRTENQSMNTKPVATSPRADASSTAALTQALRLDGVGVRYTPDGPWALSGIDAVVPAHAVTALVGRSGAGKSTLADLLLGLLEPDQGRMLVDGQPVAGTVARQSWRRRVGYVPQDCFLFHDTIRANLAMACRTDGVGGGDERLWTALEQADAADFVRALPQGLDTMVGDRGALLSGGQRQRLALARALLSRPDLLILDEATSALDHESEQRILKVIQALKARITIVLIAHRPSTVQFADHAIVLDAGRLAASGPWPVVKAASPHLTHLAMD
jgi:ATP-binding cassette, subfamily C, bacterial